MKYISNQKTPGIINPTPIAKEKKKHKTKQNPPTVRGSRDQIEKRQKEEDLREVAEGKGLGKAGGVDGSGGDCDDAGEVVLVRVGEEVVALPERRRRPCVDGEGEPLRHLDRHRVPPAKHLTLVFEVGVDRP